jgi:cold shock protein
VAHLGPAVEVHVPLWISVSRHPNMAAVETRSPLGMSPADSRRPARAQALAARAMRVPVQENSAVEAPRRQIESAVFHQCGEVRLASGTKDERNSRCVRVVQQRIIGRDKASAESEEMMASGTIKRVVRDKGFGFIADDNQQQEYFFHSSACRGTRFDELREGQRVSFEVGQSTKGPRAETVTPE